MSGRSEPAPAPAASEGMAKDTSMGPSGPGFEHGMTGTRARPRARFGPQQRREITLDAVRRSAGSRTTSDELETTWRSTSYNMLTVSRRIQAFHGATER